MSYSMNPKEEIVSSFDLNESSEIREVLTTAIRKGASDVHISIGKPLLFRLSGQIIPQSAHMLEEGQIKRLVHGTMNEGVKENYKQHLEVDYSYTISYNDIDYRFRINAFTQKSSMAMVIRLIPNKILSLRELDMPVVLERLADLPRGLVLVTGPTGSGKSTTLASIIDLVNRNQRKHILTLEDPIEFIHQGKKAVVNQREIGQDSQSFNRALKSALRQDPDVILLGEMRDLETISMAVTLAETGHLVFATLHTSSAPQTIDRIIDVFPPEQQAQIRVQLANTLEAIVCQTLLPRKNQKGRVCANEILIMDSAARSIVRTGKSTNLSDVMQTNVAKGMHTLEQDLFKKVVSGLIEPRVAIQSSSKPAVLEQMFAKKNIDF